MSDLRAAAERWKQVAAGELTQALVGKRREMESLCHFASELLTREWLDAPTEPGWWWFDCPDDRGCEMIFVDTETNALCWWKYSGKTSDFSGRKWCRAYVPELPS